MDNVPRQGDEVFGVNGRAATYVCHLNDGHIVLPLCEDNEGVLHEDAPEVWSEVFGNPPAEKLNETVAKLRATAEELRAEIGTLRSERREQESANRERLLKLKKHAALSRIEDYLDGKFAFFVVVPDYGIPEIKTADAALAPTSRYDREPRLLSLFGRSNGDLLWAINQYSDGSGSNFKVYPCASEPEAVALVRALYDARVVIWRNGDKAAAHQLYDWSRRLPREWITVPDDVRSTIRDADVLAADRRVQEIEEALTAAREVLAKAKEEQP